MSIAIEQPATDMTTVPSPRILIVDEDDADRYALASVLDTTRYRVALAASTEELRTHLCGSQPDLILCDTTIRGMHGAPYCRWLKTYGSWRYVPVIATTRMDDPAIVTALLDAGADDVIVKPVGKARELNMRVAVALRIRDRYLHMARRAFEDAVAQVSK